ncbi:MAG: uracil phosphoribosyltransferase [Oscillospiraceae bacterium]|nr:uracil phosphoribosyltransferase [Oscillospiraceae bacterium]
MQYLNAFVFDHPLIQHKMSILRDKNTGTKDFRELVDELTTLMVYEVTKDLPLKEVEIETPMAKMKTKMLEDRPVSLVPILRAGLGMVAGVQKLLPTAKVGFYGLFRDHDTHEPVEYYCKMPENIANSTVFVLDPMFATGGSVVAAVDMLKKAGCRDIRLVCMVAAKVGVERMSAEHPDVPMYCAALDDVLDENAYIVPGLGDAGDRIYGTK